MSKFEINIASVNVYFGAENTAGTKNRGLSGMLDAALAAALVDAVNSSATECEAESNSGVADACAGHIPTENELSQRTDAQVLHHAKVMVAVSSYNSSTGWVLDDSRKQGNAVDVSDLDVDTFVVVQASSAEGEALQRAGFIETTGFINKYYTSGNFGSTVHSSMDKAEEYSDGDCVAVEVYVAKARNLQSA